MATALTEERLIEILDSRIDARFKQERTYQRAQLDEERKYYAQLIQSETQTLRQQLERIESAVGGDAKDALLELDVLKERMNDLTSLARKDPSAA